MNTQVVPAVSASLLPSSQGMPGINSALKILVIPLAVRIYVFVDILCLKWCWIFPCGFDWCRLLDITVARWSMGAISIEGPSGLISFADATPPISGSVVAYQTSSSCINVEWHGFREEESDILGYSVCVGRMARASDLMPCTGAGLASTRAILSGQLRSIPHGSTVFVTVWY